MKIILLFLSLFLALTEVAGQYDERFQQEYFFGNLPSAKVEAMGRGDAAIGGSVASLFFNPAGLGGIENQELFLSTSAPYYILKNSNYYFAGYARRVIPGLVAAFSINSMAVGETGFRTTINGEKYPLDKPKSTNYALSVAGTPLKNLYVGLNFNIFRIKLFDDVSPNVTVHFDLGALYKLELTDQPNFNHHLQFGLSINNITASKINLESPKGDKAKETLPVIGRFAAAYFWGTQITLPGAGTGPLDLTFTTEYQNTFNTEFRNSFLIGIESVLWHVLAFRLGFFTQSLDPVGFENNKDRITDLTYGFGAIIPLFDLTNGKIPFRVNLDYCSLKQPPYIHEGTRNPNMRTFTLRLVWDVPVKMLAKN